MIYQCKIKHEHKHGNKFEEVIDQLHHTPNLVHMMQTLWSLPFLLFVV